MNSVKRMSTWPLASNLTEASGQPLVLLVVPPVSSVLRPSLGVSNLKASLSESNCRVEILYYSFAYAEEIGVDINQDLAERSDTRLLVVEWIFAGAQQNREMTERDLYYLERYVRPALSPEIFEAVVEARRNAWTFIDKCAADIVRRKPSIVGFSTTFQQNNATLAIAERVKVLSPDTSIVIGGPNCEGDMGRALLEFFPFVDHVFSGESEVTFPTFVSRILNSDASSATPARGYHEPTDGRALLTLDELPIPDFEEFFSTLRNSTFGHRTEPALTFESSRGCWWGAKHHCTFCGLNGSTMSFRAKTPERVLRELSYLRNLWNVENFAVSDNILDHKHINGVFRNLDSSSDMKFFYEVKANIAEEQLKTLARGGVTSLQPGIESLCDHVLKLMDKGITRLLNLRFIRLCQEIGILPLWNVLVGFPGEQDDEYEEVLQLLPYIEHLYPPASGPSHIRVDRFSPLYHGTTAIGFDTIEPLPTYSYVYDLTDEQLARIAYFFRGQSKAVVSEDVCRRLQTAIERWKERFWHATSPASLTGVALGNAMLIHDTRSVAQQSVALLDEVETTLLRHARSPRKMATLVDIFPGRDDVEPIIQSLISNGYLVAGGDELISVVIEDGHRVREMSEAVHPAGKLREPLVQEAAHKVAKPSNHV
ncbi:RiPP maturation radical SAM C-methyltransferase [Gluconobacter cerinus]|uniref:RiPP maturation radical SAM C-methyltransferase n=1 Tax=Gluconobacter cerinus TaxID=38307 RepID=UPI001B8B6C91|nr:RiPP maturation radical SAM C-methyltransferase [Gluconobacter cerinus]MBS1042277.1 RiPP maturation radical SAM C-methyltransferase [Gluconobacter cerinus]MBS1048913.1 RiPP maturation radical SAM C-methyltransferase [Gluconobacter cerinus]